MSQTSNSDPLNGDLSHPVTVDTAALGWTASPSPSVWRKRETSLLTSSSVPKESQRLGVVIKYEIYERGERKTLHGSALTRCAEYRITSRSDVRKNE